MKNLNLKKCKSSSKGITLIALIITIIVLLILAGVTIAQLTGTDSAPVKANEAKQKNDIGTAKDDVSLTATNALTEAYETAYVADGVSAKNASTTVGTYVRTKLNQKYGETGTFKTGLATITATPDGNITIWTTDFEITGEIAEKGGQLTWGEMVPNTPGVFLNKTEATLNPGGTLTLTARKKSVSENITWSKVSGSASITVTEDQNDNLKATVNVNAGASNGDSAIIKASAGGYEPTCTIRVEKVAVTNVAINSAPTSMQKGQTTTLSITTTGAGGKSATPANIDFTTSNSNVIEILNSTTGQIKAKGSGSATVTVTADDVSAQCTITVSSGTAEATSSKAATLNGKIGDTVSYSESSGEVTSWRLFYASDSEVFLISSNVVASATAFGSSSGIPLKQTGASSNYTGATDVFGTSYGELYNKNWFATNSTDTQNRSKATAYLCDSTNWGKYVGTTAPSGTYAVGGPTKELLVRSWKASGQSSDTLENLLADTTATTDGYAYDKPSALRDGKVLSSILKENGTGKGLYNTGDAHYWLASPSSDSISYVCYVRCSNSLVNSSISSNAAIGVRPVVSIPITKINENTLAITQ